MAVLNTQQLVKMRQMVQREDLPIDYVKTQLNTALQNIEDWFEANRTALGTAIGGTFTGQQKKAFVKSWLFSKFGRE